MFLNYINKYLMLAVQKQSCSVKIGSKFVDKKSSGFLVGLIRPISLTHLCIFADSPMYTIIDYINIFVSV